jgi:hypothetical protein
MRVPVSISSRNFSLTPHFLAMVLAAMPRTLLLDKISQPAHEKTPPGCGL